MATYETITTVPVTAQTPLTKEQKSELLGILPSLESNVGEAESLSRLIWNMISELPAGDEKGDLLQPIMNYVDWLTADLRHNSGRLYGYAYGESVQQHAERMAKIQAEIDAKREEVS